MGCWRVRVGAGEPRCNAAVPSSLSGSHRAPARRAQQRTATALPPRHNLLLRRSPADGRGELHICFQAQPSVAQWHSGGHHAASHAHAQQHGLAGAGGHCGGKEGVGVAASRVEGGRKPRPQNLATCGPGQGTRLPLCLHTAAHKLWAVVMRSPQLPTLPSPPAASSSASGSTGSAWPR